MKLSFQITTTLALSSLLASAAKKDGSNEKRSVMHNVRRQLQLFDEFFPSQQEEEDQTPQQGPLDDLLDDLANGGLESLFNISDLLSLDPLTIGTNDMSWTGVDTLGITNCAGSLTVRLEPLVLTGLSTIDMVRFELVRDTEQVSTQEDDTSTTNSWWPSFGANPLVWSGTFDMLVTAGTMVLDMGISIQPSDTTCVPQELAAADGSFSTGIQVTLANPVVEMFLEIGGTTPQGFLNALFGDTASVADSLSTNNVTFAYDLWTVTFDNPAVNETINVAQVIEMADAFLQDTFNMSDFITDFDIPGPNANTTTTDFDFSSMGGITTFIQEQVNLVSKSAGF